MLTRAVVESRVNIGFGFLNRMCRRFKICRGHRRNAGQRLLGLNGMMLNRDTPNHFVRTFT